MNKAVCSVNGCNDNRRITRGLCNKHYKRYLKYGDPNLGRSRYSSPKESFAARTVWHSDCLMWVGAKTADGYGVMIDKGSKKLAHRYAWESHNGEIPEGMSLDHTCWNRACCNIKHLRLATHAENLANRKSAQSNSSSGVRNVYPQNGRWRVIVRSKGKTRSFGMYSTIEEAEVVAIAARRKLFGEFSG